MMSDRTAARGRVMRTPRFVLPLVLLCFALTACAETQLFAHAAKQAQRSPNAVPPSAPAPTAYKVGKPYKVAGTWYYPAEDFSYNQTGVASWYGPGFHGRRTANGERFDQNALTAAHPTLPMPSAVRVTNLENGRSLVLRVNDRGPFARGRIIDVSRAAADKLGFRGAGTAKVRVEILGDESRRLKLAALNSPAGRADQVQIAAAPARDAVTVEELPDIAGQPANQAGPAVAAADPAPRREPVTAPVLPTSVQTVPVGGADIFVQAGAFSDFGNALRMRDRISAFGATAISRLRVSGAPIYRVRLGPVASVTAADGLLDRLVGAGVTDATLVIE